MARLLEIKIGGMPELSSTIGILDVSMTYDWSVLWRGFIRPSRAPGRVGNVMARAEYTLEGIIADSFDNSGVNVFNSAQWAGYSNEPKYAAAKKKHGGGTHILVWEMAQDPLRDTFKKDHKEHIETVDQKGFRWGTRRGYAGRLHLGGFYQPWDRHSNTPARPLIRPTQEMGFQLAKGMQRIIVGRIQDSGMKPGAVLKGLRSEPGMSNGPEIVDAP